MPKGKSPQELGYETQDVQPPLVIWSLAVLTVFTVVTVFGLLWIFSARDAMPSMSNTVPAAIAEERPLPPYPRLQADPPLDLHKYEAESGAYLHGYGWVNEAEQIVHIPIEKALERALKQGYPTGPPALAPSEPEAVPAEPAAGETESAAEPGS